MEELADRIRQRIADGRFRVSDHAQVRLDERGLLLSEILASVRSWSIIETYHSDRMGPSLLAKHELPAGPIHAVWGMIDENAVHAVLVTVYLPDKEKWMSSSQSDARLEQVTRLVEEGGYIAKVPVTLIYEPDDPTNWGPYLSADDALKLDEVRNALRRGDVEAAARHGEIFELTKVA